MQYFETFPKLLYDIDNSKNLKLVSDIFRRIKIRESLKDNAALYSLYDVPSGETPETTAFKHFGSTDYFWVIMISNDITDRYYGWPLSESDFETYVKISMLSQMVYIIMKLHNQVVIPQVMDHLIIATR